ncbi:hypothetical protein NDU88_010201, partial [Pleurodeles waltl]
GSLVFLGRPGPVRRERSGSPDIHGPGFPKQRRKKGTGLFGVLGTAWSGSEGEVWFTRYSWPRISQTKKKKRN